MPLVYKVYTYLIDLEGYIYTTKMFTVRFPQKMISDYFSFLIIYLYILIFYNEYALPL